MFMLNVFTFYCLAYMVSGNGLANLLGFYTSFRKLCLCRCGLSKGQENYSRGDRTLGSDSANEMPWLVTIHAGTITIRGTLISDAHVITAAYPLYRKSSSEIIVTLGSNELCKERSHALNNSVEAILVHPGYSEAVKSNDIALLRLRNPVQFSQFISPICMPIHDTFENDNLAWIALWLKKKPELCSTRLLTIPMLSSQTCMGNTFNSSITIYGKGCLGPLGTKGILSENDIGGPIMARWLPGFPFRLVGVITHTSTDGVYPLFTRIVDNLLWIQENIRKDCQCF